MLQRDRKPTSLHKRRPSVDASAYAPHFEPIRAVQSLLRLLGSHHRTAIRRGSIRHSSPAGWKSRTINSIMFFTMTEWREREQQSFGTWVSSARPPLRSRRSPHFEASIQLSQNDMNDNVLRATSTVIPSSLVFRVASRTDPSRSGLEILHSRSKSRESRNRLK